MADDRHEVAGGLPCETLVMRLYYMDQLLVNLLRQLFSRPEQNLVPGLQHLRWVKGSEDGAEVDDPGSIRIYHWSKWNPAAANATPAIIVKGNDFGFSKIGIANRHSSPYIHQQGSDEYYTKVVAGSHRVLSVALTAGESHLLSMTVADHLQSFSQQLRGCLSLDACEVSQVGAPRKFRELPHTFASPVNLEYGFYQTWSVTPAAPRLNRVRFKMGTQT